VINSNAFAKNITNLETKRIPESLLSGRYLRILFLAVEAAAFIQYSVTYLKDKVIPVKDIVTDPKAALKTVINR
jgi:hypothetical protein